MPRAAAHTSAARPRIGLDKADVVYVEPVEGGLTRLLAVFSRTMPAALAHDSTRVLFEKQAELAAIHPEARLLSIESATRGSPAEFHPGAVAFYREKGAWR